MTIHYRADDGLGDPTGGGQNLMGLYLNTNAIPHRRRHHDVAGHQRQDHHHANVAPWLVNGANTLHLYQRDRLNGISAA